MTRDGTWQLTKRHGSWRFGRPPSERAPAAGGPRSQAPAAPAPARRGQRARRGEVPRAGPAAMPFAPAPAPHPVLHILLLLKVFVVNHKDLFIGAHVPGEGE